MLKRNLTIAVSTAALMAAAGAGAQAAKFGHWKFYDVERIQDVAYAGTDYRHALAREYKKFATSEAYEMYDWTDAEHFAGKAMRAAEDGDVAPETLSQRRIPEKHVAELSDARARLLKVLTADAKAAAPEEAARAQVNFDCWMEQQEENHQWDHIAACRTAFLSAIDRLEARTAPKLSMDTEIRPQADPAAPAGTAAPAAAATKPIAQRTAVYFGFDRATLSSSAQQTLDGLVRDISDADAIEMRVAGHADRAGPDDYNRKLSERRAAAVVEALKDRGMRVVALKELDVVAKGETEPAVSTPDGVAEGSNRRVEITVHALRRADLPALGKADVPAAGSTAMPGDDQTARTYP